MASNIDGTDPLPTRLRTLAFRVSQPHSQYVDEAAAENMREAAAGIDGLRDAIERVRVECSEHRDSDWVLGAVYALDTLKQRLFPAPRETPAPPAKEEDEAITTYTPMTATQVTALYGARNRTMNTQGRRAVKPHLRKGAEMKIDDLTIGEAKQLASLFENSPVAIDNSAWEIGKVYLIRTVTMIDTGRVVAVTPLEIILEDAAWIAETGRFADAVKKAEFGEVEPFPDGRLIVGRGAIVDAVQIKLAPRSQK